MDSTCKMQRAPRHVAAYSPVESPGEAVPQHRGYSVRSTGTCALNTWRYEPDGLTNLAKFNCHLPLVVQGHP